MAVREEQPMNLEFGSSRRVIFGPEEFNRVGKIAAEYGNRALLVTGSASLKASGAFGKTEELFRSANIEHELVSMEGEPTVCSVDEAVRQARAFQPEVIVAIGGGSVLDAAKAIGALLTNSENTHD